jgi:hypothetical protein
MAIGVSNATITTKGLHVTHVPLQTISRLAPFDALIISIIFVIYFLIYLLESFLLTNLYGDTYTKLSDTNRGAS